MIRLIERRHQHVSKNSGGAPFVRHLTCQTLNLTDLQRLLPIKKMEPSNKYPTDRKAKNDRNGTAIVLIVSKALDRKKIMEKTDAYVPIIRPEDQSNYLRPEWYRLLEEDNEYNFFHIKRGRALVINNISFRTGSNSYRNGGRHDTSRLFDILASLDFDVQICPDVTASEMLDKIRSASSNVHYDHTNADCFLCVILSHGTNKIDKKGVAHDVVYGVDGGEVYTRDIINLLSDKICPHLKNKPRILIFQACRGDDLDEGQEVRGIKPVKGQDYRRDTVRGRDDSTTPFTHRGWTQRDLEGDIMVSPTPLYKDFLVVHATPPGYSAWRGQEGSYFIQYLQEVFKEMHEEHVSFVKTLTRACNRMAVLFKSRTKDADTGKKQMPCIMSSLTKDICFRRKPTHV